MTCGERPPGLEWFSRFWREKVDSGELRADEYSLTCKLLGFSICPVGGDKKLFQKTPHWSRNYDISLYFMQSTLDISKKNKGTDTMTVSIDAHKNE